MWWHVQLTLLVLLMYDGGSSRKELDASSSRNNRLQSILYEFPMVNADQYRVRVSIHAYVRGIFYAMPCMDACHAYRFAVHPYKAVSGVELLVLREGSNCVVKVRARVCGIQYAVECACTGCRTCLEVCFQYYGGPLIRPLELL